MSADEREKIAELVDNLVSEARDVAVAYQVAAQLLTQRLKRAEAALKESEQAMRTAGLGRHYNAIHRGLGL